MNKTFVADLDNHIVYLMSNGDMSFYINLSKKNESTNITVDMKTKKKNDISRMISYYEKIDNYNISLVVPVINLSENINDYKTQSNFISKIINESYRILTSNGMNVKNNINIIKKNYSKSEFIEFFIKQFSNRVRYIALDDLVHEEVPYNKFEAASISFVVGKPEIELTIKDEEMKEIIKDVETRKTKKETKKTVSKSNTTSGYVSYYLLGFLTAVVTFFILTLLVK